MFYLLLLLLLLHTPRKRGLVDTANLPTSIVDLRGFDSSIILIVRGGIPRPMGNFPESLSQAILVGRLGVIVGFCVFMAGYLCGVCLGGRC